MNKYSIAAWTTLALLLAGPALANHCAANFADTQSAIDHANNVEANALGAATVLLPAALEACQLEELQLANAEFDSPTREPGYVSVGQSILINITELLGNR
ncbi:MAG: hypothetical protein Q8R10_13835 [Pseudomonas sp.]|uniref:hypothetical protein n=1 Tax=Pseudomonas sp. TaxID=306 RepID=UPI002734C8F1|nr:hypothetical protein [Pseudomonas sp.]MDP3847493.1 hypothetical protein [Pseudomonas sp.]